MDKKELLLVLKEACKYIDKRNWRHVLPILTTVKIEIKDSRMTIESTDLADYFTCTIPTDCPDMLTCVPAKLFRDQINVMDSGDIQIQNKSEGRQGIRIKQGRSTFNLFSLPADEFPLCGGKEVLDGWTKEEIPLICGNATLYHNIPDNDYGYMNDNKIKSAMNKLFPKYIKIDGLIAKKTKVCWDWTKEGTKYYCPYMVGNTEQRVFVDEIENYETIELGRR